jgi:hypothetical protein
LIAVYGRHLNGPETEVAQIGKHGLRPWQSTLEPNTASSEKALKKNNEILSFVPKGKEKALKIHTW